MKRIPRSKEAMQARIDKLISLGFEPLHEDSRVEVYYLGKMLSVDFSATDIDSFVHKALNEVAKDNYLQGRENLKNDLAIFTRIEGVVMRYLVLFIVCSLNGFMVFAASKGLSLESFSAKWWCFILVSHFMLAMFNYLHWSRK